jgi:hypothetical protein
MLRKKPTPTKTKYKDLFPSISLQERSLIEAVHIFFHLSTRQQSCIIQLTYQQRIFHLSLFLITRITLFSCKISDPGFQYQFLAEIFFTKRAIPTGPPAHFYFYF